MSWLRHPATWGLVATVLVTGLLGAHRSGAARVPGLERLELWTLDLRFNLRGPQQPGPEVALLAFDDRSYAEAPELWERRSGWAQVIRAAKAAGAKVIAVDALFNKPESLLPEELGSAVSAYVGASDPRPDDAADALLRRIHAELSGDEELARAIEEAGNVALILHLGDASGSPDADPSLARARYGQSTLGEAGPPAARAALASLPAFNRKARSLGFATVREDETNTVRQMDLARIFHDGVYAPLAVQAIARLDDVGRGAVAWLGPAGVAKVGGRALQAGPGGAVWLNFRGPPGTFPTFSVVDLVRGRLPAAALEGKIALIGITQLGHDKTRTPFSPGVPGAEIQATLIDNLLRGDPLRRAGWPADLAATLVLGLLVTLLFWPGLIRWPGLQVGLSLAALGAWFAASSWLFASRQLWLSWMGPGLSAGAAGVVCLALSYLGEGLQRRRLRKAFAHYLSDDVIRELMARPGKLALGGERRRLSILFSDIRGFTTLSERLAPEQLVSFLNEYLTPMTRAVLREGGLLDKYIGDAVMAVFGAPVPRPDHAAQAFRCALAMHRELEALQPRFAERGLQVAIGVGVNTGEVVVGNMGSAERFDYTVAGDSVNLASRLEGLTKVYGVFCLAGASARQEAGDGFAFREVDLVQVKGKQEAVPIFELLSGPGRVIAEYRELARFQGATADWRAGRLAQAREGFAAFAAANPDDQVAALYLDRLARLGDAAPEGWSGVFTHTEK